MGTGRAGIRSGLFRALQMRKAHKESIAHV